MNHIKSNSIRKLLVALVTASVMSGFNSSISLAGGPSFTQKDISQVGWSVSYQGTSYNAVTDTSTFYYQVVAATGEKNLSHWVLGLCENLMPTGTGNLTTIGLDPTTGTYGFKWDDGQQSGTTATYAIMLQGRYTMTTVDYAVKGGTYFAVGRTLAPCEKEVVVSKCQIAGKAFLDVNGNGVQESFEVVLANVTINLSDDQGNFLATAMTDGSGQYAFSGLYAGNYIVGVPSVTTDVSGDFNESLTAYFVASTPEAVAVTICPDSNRNDFGYSLNASAILDDLLESDPDGDGFTFSGTGKTIGFWKHQCNVVVTGKGRAQINAVTMQAYLDAVEALYIANPFELNDANEYAAAVAILGSTSSNPVDLLKKQLLGTELNQVAGLGITGTVGGINGGQLQLMIIAWAEGLVAQSTNYSGSQLLQAKDICDYINNTGE